MKITNLTVSYGETQSLPDYCNVKPALSMSATVEEGEDPAEVEARLWDQVKGTVQEMVDQALEGSGKAARHDTCQRFQVMRTYWDRYWQAKDVPEPPKLVIILPDNLNLSDVLGQQLVHAGYPESRKLRPAHARRIAEQEAAQLEAQIIDCSDGDLSRLEAALAPVVQSPEPEEAGSQPQESTQETAEEGTGGQDSGGPANSMDDGPDNSI